MATGAKFPDDELTGHTGARRKLSDLQAQGPSIVVLSRGGYCPKDRRQHEGLVQLQRELEIGTGWLSISAVDFCVFLESRLLVANYDDSIMTGLFQFNINF